VEGVYRAAGEIEHDPEKWVPVFRKDHAQQSEMTIRSHRALGVWSNNNNNNRI
jgi:hypothetical protein